MRRLFHIFLLTMLLVIAGCAGEVEEIDDPVALLTEAANNIRNVETFRVYIEQTGARYNIPIILGEGIVDVGMIWARAQYIAPDELGATTRLITGPLTLDVQIYSKGAEQWYQLPPAGWVQGEFAPGFNPTSLIADDTGFQAALTTLQDLEYVGAAELEDGQPVYHLRGTANGADISSLVVGLIQAEGTVPVDVYINRETRYPARIVITQPETVTEEEPEPTTWIIDVYDVNAPNEVVPPEAQNERQTDNE